jgi:hypothetical protein
MGDVTDGDWVAVERLLAEGEEYADAGRDAEAPTRFQAAWDLLPEPKAECEPALRVLAAAIADSYFHLGNWQGCYKTLQTAVKNWESRWRTRSSAGGWGKACLRWGTYARPAIGWDPPTSYPSGESRHPARYRSSDKGTGAALPTPLRIPCVSRGSPPPGACPRGARLPNTGHRHKSVEGVPRLSPHPASGLVNTRPRLLPPAG